MGTLVTGDLPEAISYELAAGGRHDRATLQRREQRDGTVLWGIYEDDRTCLTAPGVWSYEAMPSSRTDAYLAEARRPFGAALELWRRHLVVACGGGTWRGSLVGNSAPEACLRLYDPTGVRAASADRKAVRLAEWVSAGTVALAKAAWEGHPEDAEVATEIDCDFRSVLALAADGWRAEGVGQAAVADGSGFAGGVADALGPAFEVHGGEPTLRAVRADLLGFLASGRRFPACHATLGLEDGTVVARVADPAARTA